MNMEFRTRLPVDQAVRNLQAAIQEPPLAIVDLRSKLHLEGEVTLERVVLRRERGRSTSYGQFEGRFTTDGDAIRLIGRFIRRQGGIWASGAGFHILLAFMLTIVVVVRWSSHHEVGLTFGALLAGAIGASMLWFQAKNTRIEAELLREEIAKRLRGPGA